MYKGIVNGASSRNVELKNGKILLDDQKIDFDLHALSPTHFHVLHQQNSYRVEVLEADYARKQFVFSLNGKCISVQLKEELDILLEKLGMDTAAETVIKEIRSPMPGLIRAINVTEGDTVKAGDSLITLEAMKMENSIKSPTEGVIAAIQVEANQSVEKNQLLLTFE